MAALTAPGTTVTGYGVKLQREVCEAHTHKRASPSPAGGSKGSGDEGGDRAMAALTARPGRSPRLRGKLQREVCQAPPHTQARLPFSRWREQGVGG